MEGTKQNKMGVMPMGKLLMQMSVPLMMSLLIQSLYNIVDSMFVAGYSEEALTATTLVYPVQFLMIAVGVGTAVGMNALLSRRIGQKWTEEACQAAGTGLIIVLAESLVFCLLGVFAKQQIAAMLTDDPDLMRACLSYLSINLVWCWGLFLQTYAQRLLQAVGDTVLSMISLIIGAAVNIVLDPIMIFGYFGCPEMGGCRCRGGSAVQPLPQPGDPCPSERLCISLAGCEGYFPRQFSDHHHAGNRCLHELCRQLDYARRIVNGSCDVRCLLQASEFPHDADERAETGCDSDRGLQPWRRQWRPDRFPEADPDTFGDCICSGWDGCIHGSSCAASVAVFGVRGNACLWFPGASHHQRDIRFFNLDDCVGLSWFGTWQWRHQYDRRLPASAGNPDSADVCVNEVCGSSLDMVCLLGGGRSCISLYTTCNTERSHCEGRRERIHLLTSKAAAVSIAMEFISDY